MDWIEKLNETIEFIEEHLADEIDYKTLGHIACCSPFHYQRMFGYMAGIPLSEYIRRRRMTKAAIDVQNGEKIVDVANKYGYSSPTSFNRAFQNIHGIAPSMSKENGATLKSFLPLSFKISITGVEELQFRIEKKEAIRIVGVSMLLDEEIEKNMVEVPKMWKKTQTDGTIEKLVTLMNDEPCGVLGVSICNSHDKWRYFIAVSSSLSVEDTIFDEYFIQPITWAIFSGEGTGISIQELQKRILQSGYPHRDMYMVRPQILKFILTRTHKKQNMKFGFQ